ncbi:dephospho-CoA kinase [Methylococcus capsulatus str. Bath]|jgi:dephospho-CoA kinase|uniref:Dephospho-CoA kinase n=1 Tax=Methylococcus capsulatus (strain ATCC 33009 / NCIMB 11132 / Bath) TaxID=243233 RepID=COAE_METCA|nr:dephospho-CoA kinase [Methylococcus capsulatus]Q606C5.1 RecName: Full=Dephospho-CoA kinase; AltName: Full=Dephosphocoenzyme A kinase [Methylococcus capsulatus str. Bath]AAU91915.1 dephospho-CoA kinase [Methylococcus capsulatus str. Bath]
MLVVGLTGGIGAGKSTVARMFAARGVEVFEADEVAHRLLEPGQPALKAVARAFGSDILGADGRLDRAALRRRVFAESKARKRLEGIVHPLVYAELARLVLGAAGSYCVLSVPLLLETGRRRFVDRLLVVDCPESLQIERVVRRSGLRPEEVRAIMAAQVSRSERLAAADDVIVNAADTAGLEAEVDALHRRYSLLAAA